MKLEKFMNMSDEDLVYLILKLIGPAYEEDIEVVLNWMKEMQFAMASTSLVLAGDVKVMVKDGELLFYKDEQQKDAA